MSVLNASPGQMLLLSLVIGAEVFAIAALWPMSEWATTGRRGRWFYCALLAILACLALDLGGLVLPSAGPDSTRWNFSRDIEWTTLPLFIGLPDAICVASGQSLMRAGAPARVARIVALVMGAFAVLLSPLAALVAGCGLAGACF